MKLTFTDNTVGRAETFTDDTIDRTDVSVVGFEKRLFTDFGPIYDTH